MAPYKIVASSGDLVVKGREDHEWVCVYPSVLGVPGSVPVRAGWHSHTQSGTPALTGHSSNHGSAIVNSVTLEKVQTSDGPSFNDGTVINVFITETSWILTMKFPDHSAFSGGEGKVKSAKVSQGFTARQRLREKTADKIWGVQCGFKPGRGCVKRLRTRFGVCNVVSSQVEVA
uniref:Uncharacterized protein n=1 Tax=Timema bartmani TaxID=61472 RepID=A0A7R9F545_9NEOP|nr:unnamed protein product [Timema bartmani]